VINFIPQFKFRPSLAFPLIFILACVSLPSWVSAQANKAVLGNDNGRDSGYVLLRGDDDETIVYLGSVGSDDENPNYGNLQLKDGTGSEGLTRMRLYVPAGRGIMYIEDDSDDMRVDLRSSLSDYGTGGNDSYGLLRLYGDPNEGSLVHLGGSTDEPRKGQLRLRNSSDGLSRVHAFLDSNNNGTFRIFNSDQSVRSVQLSSGGQGGNVRVRSFSNTSVGSFRAVDVNGEECGQLYLTSTGGDSVLIDGCQGAKNSVMDFPGDKSRQIFYAAMEGGEIGLYTRGQGKLKDGKASVRFPRHFSAVVSEKNLTVQLTPHSADTFGLAAVKVTPEGLQVAELGGENANGNFEFSYHVQGVKRGSEDYPVIRTALVMEKDANADATSDEMKTEERIVDGREDSPIDLEAKQ